MKRFSLCLCLLALFLPPLSAAPITKPPEKTPDPVDETIRALSSDNAEARANAAFHFIYHPVKKALAPLTHLTDPKVEPEENVRLDAVRAIGEIGAKESFGPLMKVLNNDPRRTVKWVAIIALGQIRSPKAFAELKKLLLGDEHVAWRHLAAYALGYTGDEKARDLLIGALKNQDKKVRRDAARGLERLALPETCPAVAAHLPEETDAEAMRAMIHTVETLKCNEALPVFAVLKKQLDTTKRPFLHMDTIMDEAAKNIKAAPSTQPGQQEKQ